MSHAAAKAHHADAQLVGGFVGGAGRMSLDQGGGGDSSGGVLQETATVKDTVFHCFSIKESVERLAKRAIAGRAWPSDSASCFGIDLPGETQDTGLYSRPKNNENNPFIHILDEGCGRRSLLFHHESIPAG